MWFVKTKRDVITTFTICGVTDSLNFRDFASVDFVR
jgi:hypothetical protein